MTQEELQDEMNELEKHGGTKLKEVSVTVHFSGSVTYTFSNMTLEEARQNAELAWSEDDLQDANFTIDEID